MKHFILLIAFLCTTYGFSFAQKLPELEKVREIKLLEHTREDVRRILAEFTFEQNKDSYQFRDKFTTSNFEIEVTYSEGKCNDDSSSDDWNVDEWKVNQIEMIPENDLELSNLGFDLRYFKKENVYTNVEEPKILHRKDLGFIIETTNDEISRIIFVPSKKHYSKMCDRKLGKRLFTTSSFFDPKSQNREITRCYFPQIKELNLDKIEINSCNSPNCNRNTITVSSITDNPDNDVITYNYAVTGGKIVGVGGTQLNDKVFWDLSDVKPGTYTITGAVDNGCGFCGKTITKTVTVKECEDCKKP